MLFFQSQYKQEVTQLLADKEHVSDGIGAEQFLYFILLASAIFLVLSMGMTVFMLLRRKNKIKQKNIDNQLREKYQNFLSSFLILPVDAAFLGIQKRNELEYRLDPRDIIDPYRREILAQEIYSLKKNLSGQQEKQLTNYFFGLGLQTEVLKMVTSSDWSKQVKAMQLVESFNITECLGIIHKYINSENRELAIHAIVTFITSSNSLDILKEVKVILNDWECHKIVSTINRLNLPESNIEQVLEFVKDEKSPLHRLSIGLLKEEEKSMVFDLN